MSNWKERAVPVSSNNTNSTNWKDRASLVSNKEEDVSILESTSRGALQGASMGFSDELTGGLGALWDKLSSDEKSKTFSELYIKNRDESRANNKKAENANPDSYLGGQIGGGIVTAIGTAGLGAGVATVGGAVKAGAALGAIQGIGDSNGGNVQDVALDGLLGAGIGGITGGAMKAATPYISKAASSVMKNAPEYINKGASKVASLATGVDDEAFLRQIQRPTETALAQTDGFAYKLGDEALDEIYSKSEKIGRNVGETTDKWLKNNATSEVGSIGQQASSMIEEFMNKNAPSQKGFSSITKSQMSELDDLAKVLGGSGMNGDDLVKSRGYIDYIEKQAGKYDMEGTGPYSNFLKQLRGTLDSHLDMIAPEIDKANTAFGELKRNRNILGLKDERTQESVINNLFGKNKSAQQEAASKLLSKDVMDKTLDIEANKAISGAIGPSGSDFGSRRMIAHMTAIPTLGTSELVVSPTAWKVALRGLGTIEKKIGLVLEKSPDILGKYAPILNQANIRGAAALSSTHFLLQQSDPEYRQALKQLEEE